MVKSAVATAVGLFPAAKFTADWNVPSPLPNKIETLLLPLWPQQDQDSIIIEIGRYDVPGLVPAE